MTKYVSLKEAYDAYNKGLVIKGPRNNVYSLKGMRLNFIYIEDVFKTWHIKEETEKVIKVKKYQVLYKIDKEIKLTQSHYINQQDFEDNYVGDDDDSYRYTFIKMIEESEDLQDVIED